MCTLFDVRTPCFWDVSIFLKWMILEMQNSTKINKSNLTLTRLPIILTVFSVTDSILILMQSPMYSSIFVLENMWYYYFNDSKLYSGVALNLEDGFHAVTVYVGRWTFTKRRNMQIFKMRLLDFSNFLCYIICKFILFFQLT